MLPLATVGQHFRMPQAREGDGSLVSGSLLRPGHCGCEEVRRQFPSVNLALHSPLACFHILRQWTHYGCALRVCVCRRLGETSSLSPFYSPCTGARLLSLGSSPSPPHRGRTQLTSSLSLANKVHFVSDGSSCSCPLHAIVSIPGFVPGRSLCSRD